MAQSVAHFLRLHAVLGVDGALVVDRDDVRRGAFGRRDPRLDEVASHVGDGFGRLAHVVTHQAVEVAAETAHLLTTTSGGLMHNYM